MGKSVKFETNFRNLMILIQKHTVGVPVPYHTKGQRVSIGVTVKTIPTRGCVLM